MSGKRPKTELSAKDLLTKAAQAALDKGGITLRPGQLATVAKVKELVGQGKRDIVIEAPTGSGKSVLALAIGLSCRSWLPDKAIAPPSGVCIATPQKMLQDQYEEEFEVNTLKGRANYACVADPQDRTLRATDCVLPFVGNKEKKRQFAARHCTTCEYKRRANLVKAASPSWPNVLNFSTLLYLQTYASTMERTGILIVDEAHGVENTLRDFFTIELEEDELGVWDTHLFTKDVESVKTYLLKVIQHYKNAPAIPGLKVEERRRAYVTASRQLGWITSDAGWTVMDFETNKKGQLSKVIVRPKYLGPLANQALPREQYGIRIYMSATLSMTQFCSTMGLDRDQVGYVVMPSTFPVNRRPALRDVVGSMGHSTKSKTLPAMCDKINALLDQYDKVRVIIHTVSGELAKEIGEGLAPQHVYRRVLHTGGSKERALKEFTNVYRTTAVMISPSMSEGFNGKDGRARVNIITKVPYPYLGDPLISQLAHEDDQWYAEQAARTIVQQYGRVMRHAEDYGITYILDKDFNRLYNQSRDLFPTWFQDAVRVGDQKLGIKDKVALI